MLLLFLFRVHEAEYGKLDAAAVFLFRVREAENGKLDAAAVFFYLGYMKLNMVN